MTANSDSFLPGGGEMGELTRRYDWSKTAVGSSDQWSSSLHTLVQMMLTSRFPMLIFWGKELITFYNDAFRPSLGNDGKHPSSLGQRGEVSWAESWSVIGPMIHGIMAGEQAVWFEDQKLPIYREGQMGYAYWTYSFSPLTDDNGAVAGVLVTCSETTKAVEGITQLQQANIQLQQLVEQNQALRHEEQTAQQALQNAVNLAELATWHVDMSSGQVSYSERYHEWLGMGQQVSIEHAFDAVAPTDAARIKAAYLHAIRPDSDGRLDVEFSVINLHTGVPRILHIVGQAQRDEQGHSLSISGFAQDVTQSRATQLALEQQVHERTQELLQANQDLLRSNDNLQQFAYVASHDLQEPLRKIQSFSTLLLQQVEGQLSEQSQNYLARITAAGMRMSLLIKDLLAYSRIATRQQTFDRVSLNTILEEVRLTLDWEIQQRQARLVSSPLPVVSGDPTQLTQLFQNLLSNALKFTPADQHPQIQVASSSLLRRELPADVRPTSEATHFHQIQVSDQGVGFDTKYLDRIFQVFQRLHGKNEFPGSGVGLAICQRVVENHGGAITASSRPGDGATFFIYLPA